MSTYWTTVLLAAQLLALLVEAHEVKNATNRTPIKPSDNPTLAATVIIGVMATTTLSVLILLIPTTLYYKFKGSPKDEAISFKQ